MMSNRSYSKEAKAAASLAVAAGQFISRIDPRAEEETKEDGTTSTLGDRLAGFWLTQGIIKEFPGDPILNEEKPLDKLPTYDFLPASPEGPYNPWVPRKTNAPNNLGALIRDDSTANKSQEGRLWVIDPIDGTRGYRSGNGQYAIMIGFCEDNNPVVGVVYAPARGKLYAAAPERALQQNYHLNHRPKEEPRPLQTLTERVINTAAVRFDSAEREEWQKELYDALGITSYEATGSEGLRMMAVASGSASLRITEGKLHSWDLCAPAAIVARAGGKITHLSGDGVNYATTERYTSPIIAASNPWVHEKVIETAHRLGILTHLQKNNEF